MEGSSVALLPAISNAGIAEELLVNHATKWFY